MDNKLAKVKNDLAKGDETGKYISSEVNHLGKNQMTEPNKNIEDSSITIDDLLEIAKQIQDQACNQFKEKFFVTHIQETEETTVYFIMGFNGICFARAYIYKDTPDTIVLDMLSVSENARGFRIGTMLQEYRERLGRNLGCKYSFLWVRKRTWQRKWYERRGYKYHSQYPEEKSVWMHKIL